MKPILFIFFSLVIGQPALEKENIDQPSHFSEKLSVMQLNHSLLNTIVFKLINAKRQKKGLDTLEYNAALNQVAQNYQNEFELRRFKNTTSVERKINKNLYKRTKKAGFDGGLVLPIIAEFDALDYDGKSEYYIDRSKTDSEFKLYYGKKPRKNELNPYRKPIEPLNYYAFAQKLIKNLESENRKKLYAKSYKWGGTHLQWHYKSLNKRKIPQIKMIFLLGGFATAGMR